MPLSSRQTSPSAVESEFYKDSCLHRDIEISRVFLKGQWQYTPNTLKFHTHILLIDKTSFKNQT